VGKYRNRLKIIADILNAVGEGAKKTRIMYTANLSYLLLSRYLEKTIEAGLLSCNDNNRYEVTEKGQAFLERYNRFYGRYSKLEKELQQLSFEREVLERMCEINESNSDPLRRRVRKR